MKRRQRIKQTCIILTITNLHISIQFLFCFEEKHAICNLITNGIVARQYSIFIYICKPKLNKTELFMESKVNKRVCNFQPLLNNYFK